MTGFEGFLTILPGLGALAGLVLVIVLAIRYAYSSDDRRRIEEAAHARTRAELETERAKRFEVEQQMHEFRLELNDARREIAAQGRELARLRALVVSQDGQAA